MKSLLLAMAGILSIALCANAYGQWGGYGGWHMGPGMMGGWGTGWFGMIFMIVFWILVIVGLVFLVKWLIQMTRAEKGINQGGPRALDILKGRYARGEINKDEFEIMKRDLIA